MKGWLQHTTVLCLVLAVGLALVTFSVKYQVQDLKEELGDVDHRIAAERGAIHVLKAEFSHLTESSRLRSLAVGYLGLQPIDPSQLSTFGALGAMIPPPAIDDDIPPDAEAVAARAMPEVSR